MAFIWHDISWSHRGLFEGKRDCTSRVSSPAPLSVCRACGCRQAADTHLHVGATSGGGGGGGVQRLGQWVHEEPHVVEGGNVVATAGGGEEGGGVGQGREGAQRTTPA